MTNRNGRNTNRLEILKTKILPLCSVKMLDPIVFGSFVERGLARLCLKELLDSPPELFEFRSFTCCAPISLNSHIPECTLTNIWKAKKNFFLRWNIKLESEKGVLAQSSFTAQELPLITNLVGLAFTIAHLNFT